MAEIRKELLAEEQSLWAEKGQYLLNIYSHQELEAVK